MEFSMTEFDKLVDIIRTLREPGGCAWDIKQTIETLKPYVLEEAYEVVDAIINQNNGEICEELGDLMTQIVFIARIAEENGDFTIKDVCNGITEKLIRRHPHVFGDIKTNDTAEILRNWEKIKTLEKGEKRKSVLDDIPASLPSLIRAFKIQKRMSRVGFDWDNHAGVLDKVQEEFEELRKSVEEKDKKSIEDEFGDLVFSIVNAARFLDVDMETALQSSINKVEKRFRYIEAQAEKNGIKIEDMKLEEMEEYWNQAKTQLK